MQWNCGDAIIPLVGSTSQAAEVATVRGGRQFEPMKAAALQVTGRKKQPKAGGVPLASPVSVAQIATETDTSDDAASSNEAYK